MMGSVLRMAAGTALAALLAGCSMGSMFGGSDDASYANINASQTQVAQAASGALPAIATECPPIRIREGAEFYRTYAGNRTSDSTALRYQGVIDRVSRNCVVSNGVITVQMGAVGRVIVGPSGGPCALRCSVTDWQSFPSAMTSLSRPAPRAPTNSARRWKMWPFPMWAASRSPFSWALITRALTGPGLSSMVRPSAGEILAIEPGRRRSNRPGNSQVQGTAEPKHLASRQSDWAKEVGPNLRQAG